MRQTPTSAQTEPWVQLRLRLQLQCTRTGAAGIGICGDVCDHLEPPLAHQMTSLGEPAVAGTEMRPVLAFWMRCAALVPLACLHVTTLALGRMAIQSNVLTMDGVVDLVDRRADRERLSAAREWRSRAWQSLRSRAGSGIKRPWHEGTRLGNDSACPAVLRGQGFLFDRRFV